MTVVLNNLSTDTLAINDTETHVITNNGVIDETGIGVNFNNNADGALLYIAGMVSAGSTGATLDGNDHVYVAQSGEIVAGTENDEAITFSSPNNKATVAGTVTASDFAIYVNGSAADSEIFVTETGVIQGGSNSGGEEASPYSAAIGGLADVRIVNNGDIIGELNPDTGRNIAFAQALSDPGAPDGFNRSTDAEATIVNSGTIFGDVIMGDGDDSFLARTDGTVFGRVFLDTGDDLFRGADADDEAIGGNGNDTMGGGAGDDDLNGGNGADYMFGGDGDDNLAGSAGLDTLRGNMGDDTLNGGDNSDALFDGGGDDLMIGGSGNDTLTSGGGDDTLNGGQGFDTFDFNGNFGSDVLTNFVDNDNEKIDLSDVNSIRNFTDLVNNHLSQDGADTVIDARNGNEITIENFTAANLDSGDFIF